MRLGAANVGMSVAKPALIAEQSRQGITDPKLLVVPVERRRDPEGRLVVVDGLLGLTLGVVYVAEDTVTLTGQELLAV